MLKGECDVFAPLLRMLGFSIRESSMRSLRKLIFMSATVSLAACSSGNVKSARDYNAPAAPVVRHPYYSPYAPFGEVNATWTPPVWKRDGTIVKPFDPSVELRRPSYENAPWATGTADRSAVAPPGTF